MCVQEKYMSARAAVQLGAPLLYAIPEKTEAGCLTAEIVQ